MEENNREEKQPEMRISELGDSVRENLVEVQQRKESEEEFKYPTFTIDEGI